MSERRRFPAPWRHCPEPSSRAACSGRRHRPSRPTPSRGRRRCADDLEPRPRRICRAMAEPIRPRQSASREWLAWADYNLMVGATMRRDAQNDPLLLASAALIAQSPDSSVSLHLFPQSPRDPPPLSPAQRQLFDRRPARSGTARSAGRRSSSGGTSPPVRLRSCSFISTGTPGRTSGRRSCVKSRSSGRSIVPRTTSRAWRSPPSC